jgi:hypothetical protein
MILKTKFEDLHKYKLILLVSCFTVASPNPNIRTFYLYLNTFF